MIANYRILCIKNEKKIREYFSGCSTLCQNAFYWHQTLSFSPSSFSAPFFTFHFSLLFFSLWFSRFDWVLFSLLYLQTRMYREVSLSISPSLYSIFKRWHECALRRETIHRYRDIKKPMKISYFHVFHRAKVERDWRARRDACAAFREAARANFSRDM